MSLVSFILSHPHPTPTSFFLPRHWFFFFSFEKLVLQGGSHSGSGLLIPSRGVWLAPLAPISQWGWKLDLRQLMVRHRLTIWQKRFPGRVVHIPLHLVRRHRCPGSHCQWSCDGSLESGVWPPCYMAHQTPTYWSEYPLMTVALSCDFINRCHMVIF